MPWRWRCDEPLDRSREAVDRVGLSIELHEEIGAGVRHDPRPVNSTPRSRQFADAHVQCLCRAAQRATLRHAVTAEPGVPPPTLNARVAGECRQGQVRAVHRVAYDALELLGGHMSIGLVPLCGVARTQHLSCGR